MQYPVPAEGKLERLKAYHAASRELFQLVPHGLDNFTSRELAKQFRI